MGATPISFVLCSPQSLESSLQVYLTGAAVPCSGTIEATFVLDPPLSWFQKHPNIHAVTCNKRQTSRLICVCDAGLCKTHRGQAVLQKSSFPALRWHALMLGAVRGLFLLPSRSCISVTIHSLTTGWDLMTQELGFVCNPF